MRRSGIPFQSRPHDLALFFLQLVVPWLCGCSFKVSNGLTLAGDDLAAPVPAHHDMAQPARDLAHPLVRDMTELRDLTPSPDLVPLLAFRDVQLILDGRGCTATTCHQAYKPLLIPNPHAAAQWQQNYDNARADVRDGCDMASVFVCATSSPILTKPLAGDAVDHAGGIKTFASTSDPDYQTILLWIEEGARL